jgi:uncharacterized protein YceK
MKTQKVKAGIAVALALVFGGCTSIYSELKADTETVKSWVAPSAQQLATQKNWITNLPKAYPGLFKPGMTTKAVIFKEFGTPDKVVTVEGFGTRKELANGFITQKEFDAKKLTITRWVYKTRDPETKRQHVLEFDFLNKGVAEVDFALISTTDKDKYGIKMDKPVSNVELGSCTFRLCNMNLSAVKK